MNQSTQWNNKKDLNQNGRIDIGLLAVLAIAKLLIHVLVSNRYGYFRDELYFLDCARHLDWGYVDHAPLIAVYAKVSLLFGGSLPALRILPAVAGAATVCLAMIITWQLGGKRFAQALAGLCIIAVPNYLGMHGILTMNAFEPLFWMGCIYFLIRIVRSGNSRLWILFGVFAPRVSLPGEDYYFFTLILIPTAFMGATLPVLATTTRRSPRSMEPIPISGIPR